MAFGHSRDFATRIQQWIVAVSMRKAMPGLVRQRYPADIERNKICVERSKG